jgi:formylglycine-generating enzyme required for sulfatase activity
MIIYYKYFKNMNKNLILVMLLFLATVSAQAQVTIGSKKIPSPFSILELISGSESNNGNRGLRLPQLTTAQCERLQSNFGDKATEEAVGLRIFNISTRCVETWNGSGWIQSCAPVSPFDAASCGIDPSEGDKTFTCSEDPNAVAYEWFVDDVSRGETTTNSITFASAQTPALVTVACLYSPAFLKPTMIYVEGSSSWKYGSSNLSTEADIPNFWMSETPVTQAQFAAVMGGVNPSYFACGVEDNVYAPSSAKPAEQVNWYDAIAYCNKLSLKEGREPVYSVTVNDVEVDWENLTYDLIPNGSQNTDWDAAYCNFDANGYRLPTEWEWEYAARGGTLSQNYIYSGSDEIAKVAWYFVNNGNYGTATYGTKSVKTKKPNELGLYDMSGNVFEWCWNWYSGASDGYSGDSPFSTPSGSITSTGGPLRVVRGGFWQNNDAACKVSGRIGYTPSYRSSYRGCRVVLVP